MATAYHFFVQSLLIVALLVPFTSLAAQSITFTNASGREQIDLNGKWQYVIDPYRTGGMGGMPVYRNAEAKTKTDRVEYSFQEARTLWVPGSWNAQRPELYYYEGSIWYRRHFDLADKQANKRYLLRVAAANYRTTISMNGKIVGTHEGGFTPFCFEVTDLLQAGENFCIIGVDNSRRADYIPAEVTDWFNHGGLTRGVQLLEVPSTFIENYFLTLDKSSLREKVKRVKGRLKFNGPNIPEYATVSLPELNFRQNVRLNQNGITDFSLELGDLDLWSPDNPKLYEVAITAGREQITDHIGFRTIESVGKEILLNGEPIFLKGICLHDENPFRKDRGNNMEDARLMLGWAKELGCNFIRLAHYPHQENIMLLADQQGILMWEELPLYWGIRWEDPQVLEKAKRQYAELINRDFNRASSIVWSIANETAPTEERTAFLSELANYVRGLDNTRLLSAAIKKDQELDGHPDSVYTYNDPLIEQLDVLSFNEYLGWYGGLPAATRGKSFSSNYEKPIIVSEFGSGALQGFHGDSLTRWSEEFQAYHYRESLAMFDKIDGLSGMTPWILVDFMSPLRQLRGVQDGWNRKGLVSERGEKKKAFFVLKKYYENKQ